MLAGPVLLVLMSACDETAVTTVAFVAVPLLFVAIKSEVLEVLEDRYGRSSTVITTQVPTKTWHDAIGEPRRAD